jgi:2-keto-4-pentenoate hydratase/2-oxohepta-3-ene-1,7-dioic acid hydratase in catechol pathway
MKLAVFNRNRVGLVEGDALYDVTDVVPGGTQAWPPSFMSRLIAEWQDAAPRILERRRVAQAMPLAHVTLEAPIPLPINIVAAPANYCKHVGELGDRGIAKPTQSARELGFFLKASSSVVGPGGSICLPRGSTRRFDHESELAAIIGKRAKNVMSAQAFDYVFGYTCLMDITMRLEPGRPAEERPTRKSFDTFTPLGPYLVTADEIPDPQNLSNRLWVNDELRQSANTRDMTVGIAELIEIISSVMTLNPGDVIATGTPEGVGQIKPGDTVRIEIEKVGTLTLPVKEADEPSPRIF